MNHRNDNDELLRDILGDSRFASRREALLADTLGHVRSRRRMRRARQGACVVACVLIIAALVVNLRRPPRVETFVAPAKPYLLVETQPLPSAAVVESRSLPPVSLAPTMPTSEVVTTAAARFHPEVLNDEALLAMAAPNPAVLVRRGNGQAELVFVKSDEESPE